MKTMYQRTMDEIRLPEPARAGIRARLAAAPDAVPARPVRRLRWQVACAAAAALLLGAGVLGGVMLEWRDAKHGQYLFTFAGVDYATPAGAVDGAVLAEVTAAGSVALDRWQDAAERTGLPLLQSDVLETALEQPDARCYLTAEERSGGTELRAVARAPQQDAAGRTYTLWLEAMTQVGGTAEPLVPAGNMGVADVTVDTHTTPAGLTVEVAVSRVGGRVRQAETWFAQDGVLYHLYADVWGPEKGEAEISTEDFLAMLDSLHEPS